jgi:hypothetical protein
MVAKVRILDEEKEMSKYGSTETGNSSNASFGIGFQRKPGKRS